MMLGTRGRRFKGWIIGRFPRSLLFQSLAFDVEPVLMFIRPDFHRLRMSLKSLNLGEFDDSRRDLF